jgi:hypothetical protein
MKRHRVVGVKVTLSVDGHLGTIQGFNEYLQIDVR